MMKLLLSCCEFLRDAAVVARTRRELCLFDAGYH
jgi:hypothetical protein